MDTITTITVNFKTPDLLHTCITSFREHYPDVTYIVVDNGGCLESSMLLSGFEPDLLVVRNSRNVGHGPALNEALALVKTPYAFLLDSDTKTEKGGFLEQMAVLFEDDPDLFATGWLRWINPVTGIPYRKGPAGVPYIHPYACLLDVAKFRKLKPFVHHGAPARDLMRSAQDRGYTVIGFPVDDYIWHKIAGTRGRFRGQIRVATDTEPGEWRPHRI